MSPFEAIYSLDSLRSIRGHSVYQSAPSGESSKEEFDRPEGRCEGEPEGDLKGFGVVSGSPLTNARALEIAAGGGRVRSLLLSARPISAWDERREAARLLRKEIHHRMSVEFPHAPYIVHPAHLDTRCPHVVCDFVPLDADGRRFDVRPAQLRRMQSFVGAEGIISGRGSRKWQRKVKPNGELERGEKHANAIAKLRASHADQQSAALRRLESELSSGVTLEALQKSGRLTLKTTAKSGRALRSPSLTFDDVTVRFDRGVEFGFGAVLERLSAAIKINQNRAELRKLVREGRRLELERQSRLAFDRYDSAGNWLPDPSLTFDAIRHAESELRRDGWGDLADLIHPKGMRTGMVYVTELQTGDDDTPNPPPDNSTPPPPALPSPTSPSSPPRKPHKTIAQRSAEFDAQHAAQVARAEANRRRQADAEAKKLGRHLADQLTQKAVRAAFGPGGEAAYEAAKLAARAAKAVAKAVKKNSDGREV